MFVNFFQPSFKLASKQRDGAKVYKRYHPPQTPCERLLQSETMPTATKNKLREIAAELDPLKLLEEMRAVQTYLAALADGEAPPAMTSQPPDLAAFVAGLSSAWRAGEIRPTFSVEAKPRYLRNLQRISVPSPAAAPTAATSVAASRVTIPIITKLVEKPQLVFAKGRASAQALRMVWPLVCRRLEGLPNINAWQLFEELCVQFPGRFGAKQYRTLLRRVNLWRQDAAARGIAIGPKTYRGFSDRPRGRRADAFKEHWEQMAQCLEANPDQTALELLIEFQARHPGRYSLHQLRTLQKRVRAWRQQAVQRLICEMKELPQSVSAIAS